MVCPAHGWAARALTVRAKRGDAVSGWQWSAFASSSDSVRVAEPEHVVVRVHQCEFPEAPRLVLGRGHSGEAITGLRSAVQFLIGARRIIGFGRPDPSGNERVAHTVDIVDGDKNRPSCSPRIVVRYGGEVQLYVISLHESILHIVCLGLEPQVTEKGKRRSEVPRGRIATAGPSRRPIFDMNRW